MRKKPAYVPVVAAFDIETTSYNDDGDRRAIVYSYCLQVEDEITIHRTSEDFLAHLDRLAEEYSLEAGAQHLVVYVHNLAYEWAFIRFLFDGWYDAFANGKAHNVIRATTKTGIEFRCSYALTNQPLAAVGKAVGVDKMVGDLDYGLMRHHETELTAEEIGYIENDTKIIVALIRKKLDEYDSLGDIPMTATGAVRAAVGQACRTQEHQDLMQVLTLTPESYALSRAAYQGGYTHAAGHLAGQVLEKVVAYDLTSSYPSSLAQFTYPMSKYLELGPMDEDELLGLLGTGHFVVDLEAEGISSQYSFPPLSASRAQELADPVVDNGRVWSCARVRTLMTDVDLRTFMRAYDFESIRARGVWFAEARYLPLPLIEAILGYYRDKTVFKGVTGQEESYARAKEHVNSIYGMIGTDPVRTTFELQGCYLEEAPTTLEESLHEYNTARKRFLYYPWGAWCTAYSRMVLLNAIYDMEDEGVQVAYCDTDSIYAVNHPAIQKVIEQANGEISARLEHALLTQGLDEEQVQEYLSPRDRKGEAHMLGIFDCETPDEPLEAFKTLGAKRYAKVEDGAFKITVAGLRKKSAGAYVESIGGMAAFTSGLVVPAGPSGRATHYHSDQEFANHMVDYQGNVALVKQKGYIHLEETEYHMSIGVEYDAFLASIRGL